MNHLKIPPFILFLLISVSSPGLVAGQNNSPKDKPVASNAEQLKKLEDAIAPYVKKARETLPEAKKKYLAGLPKNQIFSVTIKLYDSSKKYEQVFVRVTAWKGETIQGILDNELALIHDHSKGEKLTCNESEILDWTISKPDGSEEGNFVGKFLDTYQP
jgi:uncharacterized protein YegJ (DUF2314 family)